MRHIKNILLSIRDEESKVDLSPQHVIENSRYLACYLLKKHEVLKEYVLENGFSDINQEIEFFTKKLNKSFGLTLVDKRKPLSEGVYRYRKVASCCLVRALQDYCAVSGKRINLNKRSDCKYLLATSLTSSTVSFSKSLM